MSTTASMPGSAEVAGARRRSTLAVLALVVAAVGLGGIWLAGFGYRNGWWVLPTAFKVLRDGFFVSVAGLVLGLIGLVVARPGGPRRGFVLALLAVVLGGVGAGTLMRWLGRAKAVPPIHDITTDPADPPQFVAVLPLRAGAPNPATYGGPAVAAQQEKAYPDIKPLVLPVPPVRAYRDALAAARAMGWQIDATAPTEGRIEATATTYWFGFKDDVVVRIRPQNGGSRVDVRSVSRVGGSDVGTNARRVREYLGKVKEGMPGSA